MRRVELKGVREAVGKIFRQGEFVCPHHVSGRLGHDDVAAGFQLGIAPVEHDLVRFDRIAVIKDLDAAGGDNHVTVEVVGDLVGFQQHFRIGINLRLERRFQALLCEGREGQAGARYRCNNRVQNPARSRIHSAHDAPLVCFQEG